MGDRVRLLNRRDLRRMKEPELRTQVIIPLMEAMGLYGVQLWHSTSELGKDVVCSELGKLGDFTNIAVVAKSGKVVGRSCKEAARQTRQAFKTTFRDKYTDQDRKVHKVWIVANAEIPSLSRASIASEMDGDKEEYIRYVDGDELWRLWQGHFPTAVHDLLDVVQNQIANLDPALSVRVWSERGVRGADVGVARPDLLTDDHVKFTARFNFPDTPEGRAKMLELDAAYKTGSRAVIPGAYVEFRLPKALQRLSDQIFGEFPERIFDFEISSAEDPRRIPVRVEVMSDDDDRVTLDFVELKITRQGSEEATFSNEQQNIPVRVWFTIRHQSLSGRYGLALDEGPVPVSWVRIWIDIQRVFSKPGRVLISRLDSGQVLISTRRDDVHVDELADEAFGRIVDDLCAVQDRIEQEVLLPDGQFSADERETIRQLRALLWRQTYSGTWTSVTADLSQEEAEERVESTLEGQPGAWRAVKEEWVEFGGKQLYLGRVLHVFNSAMVANVEAVQKQIAKNPESKAPIEVRLVPAGDDRVAVHYIDWMMPQVSTTDNRDRSDQSKGGSTAT